MLPVNSTIDVTRLLMNVAFNQVNSNQQLREKEIEADISRMRIQADTYLEEMRIEARMTEIKAQKDIYLALVDLSKHAYDRKMDFFSKALADFNALIREHQKALFSEKDALRAQELRKGRSEEENIQLLKDRAEINRQLADLNKISATVTFEFNARVAALSPEVRLAIPRL